MSSILSIQSQRLQDWLCDKALPFWASIAIDEQGGWYEDLSLDGIPNRDKIRRLRVQARQIYVYSLAHKIGWYSNQAIIDKSFNFLKKYGLEEGLGKGFIHLLGADYAIEDDQRDFYDHAFYLLASGWAYSSVENDLALELAIHIADFIDEKLSSRYGGWAEGVPEISPRRQNPHMHFFEASMALYDITREPRWMNYTHHLFTLFEAHFFDPVHNVIREYFEEDWTPIFKDSKETVEPGHAAEWVWLLKQYEDLSGIDTSHYAQKLYDRLISSNPLFLNDEEYIDGTPKRETKRLWVQTEFVKAHLSQASRGIKGAEKRATKTIDALFNNYLQDNGTWVDQIDRHGKPVSKTIPTSTFYHIACMIYEVSEHLRD